MKDGDHFILLDSMERISPQFCYEKLPQLRALMKEADLGMVANFGKGFLFRYNEQLEFRGSPHWYATALDGRAIGVELEKNLFWNVRDEQRSEFQWVDHYAKYMLYPAGSNHALLGLDHWEGDQAQNFQKREARRLAFRAEMVKRGYPLTLEGLREMLSKPLDNWLKSEINGEKTWSDYYRYHILGDKTVVHSHNPKDIKIIE
jgi:hypothetical protein